MNKLKTVGVRVKVFEDRLSPICPDAIFPNNWFSTHDDGTVILYPMLAKSRRLERRSDIVDFLKEVKKVHFIYIMDICHLTSSDICLNLDGKASQPDNN